MKTKSKAEMLTDKEKHARAGKEIKEILSTCINILMVEGFTEDEINILFKHCFIEEKIKSLSTEEKINYILNCDSFWEDYEAKAEYDNYSQGEISEKRRKYAENYVKEIEANVRKKMCDINFSTLKNRGL